MRESKRGGKGSASSEVKNKEIKVYVNVAIYVFFRNYAAAAITHRIHGFG